MTKTEPIYVESKPGENIREALVRFGLKPWTIAGATHFVGVNSQEFAAIYANHPPFDGEVRERDESK